MSRVGRMTGYTPVALEAICNAGLSVLGAAAPMQLGTRTLTLKETARVTGDTWFVAYLERPFLEARRALLAREQDE
jgi:hypothetical protein